MQELLRELETIVVEAWPAAEIAESDGWLLRASGGPTHRGNSVATPFIVPRWASTGEPRLLARIEQAERWYHERGQRAMFQLGPCVAPAELDAVLATRGYVREGDALCAAAPVAEVLARSAAAPERAGRSSAHVESSPGSDWIETNAKASRFASQIDGFLGFIARLGTRCRFVTVHTEQGEPAATALGIRSGHQLGVYAMLTVPSQRRNGAARAALHALAQSALEDGTSELYLLVENGNTAARNLYAGCGFRDLYGYHYRAEPRA